MPLTSSGGSAGKLTLTRVRGANGAASSGAQHPLRPGLGGGERHRVAHPLLGIALATSAIEGMPASAPSIAAETVPE